MPDNALRLGSGTVSRTLCQSAYRPNFCTDLGGPSLGRYCEPVQGGSPLSPIPLCAWDSPMKITPSRRAIDACLFFLAIAALAGKAAFCLAAALLACLAVLIGWDPPAPSPAPSPAPVAVPTGTVRELRAMARRHGLPRTLYTYGRKADLIAALQGVA